MCVCESTNPGRTVIPDASSSATSGGSTPSQSCIGPAHAIFPFLQRTPASATIPRSLISAPVLTVFPPEATVTSWEIFLINRFKTAGEIASVRERYKIGGGGATGSAEHRCKKHRWLKSRTPHRPLRLLRLNGGADDPRSGG